LGSRCARNTSSRALSLVSTGDPARLHALPLQHVAAELLARRVRMWQRLLRAASALAHTAGVQVLLLGLLSLAPLAEAALRSNVDSAGKALGETPQARLARVDGILAAVDRYAAMAAGVLRQQVPRLDAPPMLQAALQLAAAGTGAVGGTLLGLNPPPSRGCHASGSIRHCGAGISTSNHRGPAAPPWPLARPSLGRVPAAAWRRSRMAAWDGSARKARRRPSSAFSMLAGVCPAAFATRALQPHASSSSTMSTSPPRAA